MKIKNQNYIPLKTQENYIEAKEKLSQNLISFNLGKLDDPTQKLLSLEKNFLIEKFTAELSYFSRFINFVLFTLGCQRFNYYSDIDTLAFAISHENSHEHQAFLRLIDLYNKEFQFKIFEKEIEETPAEEVNNILFRLIGGCEAEHFLDLNLKKRIEIILKKTGLDLNYRFAFKQTPLLLAIKRGVAEFVTLLVKYGANIEEKDAYGNTPLMLAVEHQNIDIVKILLENNANVDEENDFKNSPLLLAIDLEETFITQLLLQKNAFIEVKDRNEDTPLMLAIKKSNVSIVQMLLKKGANINSKDIREMNAKEIAEEMTLFYNPDASEIYKLIRNQMSIEQVLN